MSSSRLFVGIDIGGTKVAAAAISPAGAILGRAQAATAGLATRGAFVAGLAALAHEALAAAGCGGDRPLGVGIGCTGPVDPTRGTVHNPYTLPLPDGSDLVSPLRAALQAPVVLENDADAAALGESWLGAGAGRELVVCITLGTGIGVGVVRRGRIVRGAGGAHPEAGHLALDPAGPPCYCGVRGCWEALAAGPAIARTGQEAARGAGGGALLQLAGGRPEAVTAELVFQAARAGDPVAGEVVARAARANALGVFNLLHTLAPDAIILGGGMVRHYDLFEPAIRTALAPVTMAPVTGLLIAPARLGQDAGLLGAARAAAGES